MTTRSLGSSGRLSGIGSIYISVARPGVKSGTLKRGFQTDADASGGQELRSCRSGSRRAGASGRAVGADEPRKPSQADASASFANADAGVELPSHPEVEDVPLVEAPPASLSPTPGAALAADIEARSLPVADGCRPGGTVRSLVLSRI